MSRELKRLFQQERPEEVSIGEIVGIYENNEAIYDVRIYGGLVLTLANRAGRSFSLKDRVGVSFPLGIKSAGHITHSASQERSPLTLSIILGSAEG